MSIAKGQRATSSRQIAARHGRPMPAPANALTSPVARSASPDLDAARTRLASLPPDFTDWVFDDPAWPADAPEVIGPRN